MLQRMIMVLFVAALVLGVSQVSFAQTPEMPSQSAAVDAGNKICPVSGEKIDEKMKATYEYNGKIYNFCCPACIEEFKKDPDKYIQKVEEELQAESKEQAAPQEHEMGMMQGPEASQQEEHPGHQH